MPTYIICFILVLIARDENKPVIEKLLDWNVLPPIDHGHKLIEFLAIFSSDNLCKKTMQESFSPAG